MRKGAIADVVICPEAGYDVDDDVAVDEKINEELLPRVQDLYEITQGIVSVGT